MDESQIITQIHDVLEALRPSIQMHGGDISFVSYVSDVVTVALHGSCVGCPISEITLKMGIEEAIKAEIPTVKEVVAAPFSMK